ncbi:MAG TPA: UDP-N-acetylmuramate--L-alanine ligase [Terriglobales bacterium]|nr:UDP-N-acetylmuramate--L-alanine ligase [Terriglobales bacterium]
MLSKVFRVHFVGIGGIGMSGIAEVLLVQGWPVSGSDVRGSALTERLAGMGARIHIGHAAENLGDAEVVVVSSAVGGDNPEMVAARARQIPVIPRAEMLAELMRLKFGIAVAGMHGKTTTTSMIATVLTAVGLDPTVIVGGRLDSIGSNARLGNTPYLVAEADESDRSFLQLSPIVAVITNLDREHLDCYRDLADIQDAFVEFANRVPFYGTVLAGADDEATQAILPRLRRRALTYGLRPESDVRVLSPELEGLASRFRLELSPAAALAFGRQQVATTDLGEFRVMRPGMHNIVDATAAVSVGLLLGRDLEVVRAAIASFAGVDRRFQIRGEVGGVTVVDDYGHHPTELAATLAAAQEVVRSAQRGGRVLMIFQPHRFTRTHHLLDEFAAVLKHADECWLLDIYSAGEAPIAGVSAERLAQAASQRGGRVHYAGGAEAAISAAVEASRPGDLILTQGAGSVSGLGEKLLQALRSRRRAAASEA